MVSAAGHARRAWPAGFDRSSGSIPPELWDLSLGPPPPHGPGGRPDPRADLRRCRRSLDRPLLARPDRDRARDGDRHRARRPPSPPGHGLLARYPQLPFRGYAIDFAFPECKLAVEINGWAYHRSQKRWMTDQNKSNALTGAGWSVLNYTWHHLTEEPEVVITAVAEMIGGLAA
ncbi:DUF559 domain-containing protein [Tsukamurella spumae]|uniref:DUF559 domain-containing protein n=1 Tax=Tsukamurella spumae TaxID=44753 RepID=A0A846WX60_9ACTN|nr:DUF559 domain-containing protein [Tsukamurella spumae]NKY17454.1 DUF559 domain-containing protein [Tsukamurella spumae]